jgi:hypothetical protein
LPAAVDGVAGGSEKDVSLASVPSRPLSAGNSQAPPVPAESAKPLSSSGAEPVKKRARAVLSDSDSEPSTPVAKPASKQPASSEGLAEIPPPRSTPTVAVQDPWQGSIDVDGSSDEDDVPLGNIIHKTSSPSASPKPPSPKPAAVDKLPSNAAQLSPETGPVKATTQSTASTSTATSVPTPSTAAVASQPRAAMPLKEEPFYVGSDLGSDEDDDIIFVAERPPGHQLVIPPKETVPSTEAQAQPAPAPEPEQADDDRSTPRRSEC